MSLAALSRILPLPEEDLQQVLEYAKTLSKQAAAEHFNNLLGESPQSIEFISAFNSSRPDPKSQSQAQGQQSTSISSSTHVPKSTRAPKKKKAPIGTPAPRQIQDNYAVPGTAYKKKDEEDYISGRTASSNAFALNQKPETVQAPIPRAPPSAAGALISDFSRTSKKNTPNSSKDNSRTSSPAPRSGPKTKVNITGGTSMQGASKTLNELESAIRSLELSTNPSKQDDTRRKCNCIATRHPLLAAAPNCLNCGKVICVKEGLGPCTFCGTPLISSSDLQSMIRSLRDERGKEKMNLDNQSHRRAEISQKPAPFSTSKVNSTAEGKALEHRDKLLNFQANNAKRTTVHDEAADFETPEMGTSMWTTPQERALQLKRQQKVLASMEWNARPEYERRKQVVSLNLVGGKLMKKVGYEKIEQPEVEDTEDDIEAVDERLGYHNQADGNAGGGTFSRNPLLGGLIRPVWTARTGTAEEDEADKENAEVTDRKQKSWRRVQDDLDDNEAVILDGGVYGGDASERRLWEEEHAVS